MLVKLLALPSRSVAPSDICLNERDEMKHRRNKRAKKTR